MALIHESHLTDQGPTRFGCGSHHECFLTEEECKEKIAFIEPTAPAGAAILFDMRLLHGGGENRSSQERPVLYITYVRPWYKDYVNFHERQTADFDKLSPAYRRVTTRIDTDRYVQTLEEKLRAFGVDPLSLQSNYEYNPLDFRFRQHGNKYKAVT